MPHFVCLSVYKNAWFNGVKLKGIQAENFCSFQFDPLNEAFPQADKDTIGIYRSMVAFILHAVISLSIWGNACFNGVKFKGKEAKKLFSLWIWTL